MKSALCTVALSFLDRHSCMIGVIDAHTFIYSNNNGIQRSTDQGATWQRVSDFQPRSKIPVLFKKKFYLCTSQGLIVSKDKGATWQLQGSAIDLAQGPCFGADEVGLELTLPFVLGLLRSEALTFPRDQLSLDWGREFVLFQAALAEPARRLHCQAG
jgi:hypothetical protein